RRARRGFDCGNDFGKTPGNRLVTCVARQIDRTKSAQRNFRRNAVNFGNAGMKTRTIGVVTTARSDYGIYRPVLRAIEAEETLRLQLFVGGMHLAPQYGMTVRTIEADGFEIVARVEMLMDDSPEGIAKSMSRGVGGFAEAYAKNRPDLLVVLGDRFEMLA